MTVYFIEHLSLWSWLTSLVPYFMRRRAGAEPVGPCYVFDGGRSALWMARRCSRLTGVSVEPLRFRLIDVRDTDGQLVRLTIAYQDLAEVQAQVMNDPLFHKMVEQAGKPGLSMYLAKALTSPSLTERGTLWRALFVIQVCQRRYRRLSIQLPRLDPSVVLAPRGSPSPPRPLAIGAIGLWQTGSLSTLYDRGCRRQKCR